MDDLFERANFEYKNCNFTLAEELYSDFITQNFDFDLKKCKKSSNCKNICTAFNNRGQIKYLRVDFTDAVEDYSYAISISNENEVVLYNRGLIHYRMGRYTKAMEDFDMSLSINPKFTDSIKAKEVAKLEQSKIGGDRIC